MAYSLRLIYGLLAELTNMTWPEFMQPYVDKFVQWVNSVLEYWDLDYLEYLLWLFLPIFVAFVLPILILFFIYGSVIFIHIYGLRHRIREAYASSYWDGARTSLASFWDGVGYLWHGYECNGLDNIPDEGPALFVTYHGTLPIDIYYLISKCILYKKRTIHVVGDKFVFKIPGWGAMCKLFCVTPGTVEDCISNLKQGNLLIIAPGGVREALFSNPVNYQIMWGRRLGFAKVVLGSNAPVIPMFTENSRDSFRTPRWGRKCFRGLYEKTRLPICPIYGGFPVKMVSHLGKPITFSEDTPPDDIKHIVKNAVADLIRQHQRLPGSIFRSLWQRFKKNRYDYPLRDIPLLDRNTTNGTTCENGGTQETIVVEPLEHGINEIQQIPLRPRQTDKDVESIGYGPELDPLALDDEHDPELNDNDESIDRL
uniref:Phospholipid/glycerol acyltransferase domain-containing protein n=1 Tax=Panagrolaimus sp. JU765 TaxID=591449 RepID=A0AC34PUA4_9BILA